MHTGKSLLVAKGKSRHPIDSVISIDESDHDTLNEETPQKPAIPALRSFYSIEREKHTLPAFPPTIARSADLRSWKQLTDGPDIVEKAGPTPTLRLFGVPQPHEEGENLPQHELKAVRHIHDVHNAENEEIAKYLFDEGLDDSWYVDSEAAYIATLSSIGKAEHAMRCLNHDIKRYTALICRLHEMKDRDLKMINELNTQRMVAIDNQKLVERLHRERVEAEHAAKALKRQQRLDETSNDLTYSREVRRIASTGNISTQRFESPGPRVTSTSKQESFRDARDANVLNWQGDVSNAELEDMLRKKRKAEKQAAHHAAKRAKGVLEDQSQTGPSAAQVTSFDSYQDQPESIVLTQASLQQDQAYQLSSQSSGLMRPTTSAPNVNPYSITGGDQGPVVPHYDQKTGLGLGLGGSRLGLGRSGLEFGGSGLELGGSEDTGIPQSAQADVSQVSQISERTWFTIRLC